MNKFEEIWQERLRENLQKVSNRPDICKSMDCDLNEPAFSSRVLPELKQKLGEKSAAELMIMNSCEYPASELTAIRNAYQENGDLKQVLDMLQEKFEKFLQEVLHLEPELLNEIQKRGWGLAGKQEGNLIRVVKIPKSGNIRAYFSEKDKNHRRKLYCHCLRLRDYIDKENIDPVYCFCGAGFYKKIWEYITQKKVDVSLVKSIIKGDDRCEFEIRLAK